VVAQNLERRHLDATDRAFLAEKLTPLYEAEAEERQKAAGSHGKEGGRGRTKQESLGGKVPPRVQREPKSIERASKAAKSNPKYVAALKPLKAEAPDLHADLGKKKISTIMQAMRMLRERKREARRKTAGRPIAPSLRVA